MKNMYIYEKFKRLLTEALDGRTQKQFAQEAGLSQYGLTNLMRNPENVPHKSTLQKIAAASHGKVTEVQLYEACGYTDTSLPRGAMSVEDCLLSAYSFRDRAMSMCGTAMKYPSCGAFLRDVASLEGIRLAVVQTSEPLPYEGIGRNFAEQMSHCRVSWICDNFSKRYYVACILFYCITEKGGYIISDCAFDMDTLIECNNLDAFRQMSNHAKHGDVSYGDYPVVTWTEGLGNTPEERLLNSLFGGNE